MASQTVNWAIYNALPVEEAKYQLSHVEESKVNQILVSHFICLPLAFVATLMRFVSRRIGKVAFGADDAMIIVAMIFEVTHDTAVLIDVFNYGSGRHAILVNDPVKNAQISIVAEVFYPLAIGAVKLSVLLLYGRIFPGKGFRRLLFLTGAFVSACTVVLVPGSIFQCRPVQAAWDFRPGAHCLKIGTLWMAMAGLNVLTDLIILFAPLPRIWRLQMPLRIRMQLIGIFSVGVFVTIVSTYRIPQVRSLSSLDAPWSDIGPAIWSMVEVNVGIICACAITWGPLFNRIFNVDSKPTPAAADAPSYPLRSDTKISSQLHGSSIAMESVEEGRGSKDVETPREWQ